MQSRNQILGGSDVDSLGSIFLSSIVTTFLNIRQTQQFLKRFVNEISGKIVVRKSLAPQANAKKAESADYDGDQTRRPPISAIRAS